MLKTLIYSQERKKVAALCIVFSYYDTAKWRGKKRRETIVEKRRKKNQNMKRC